MRYFALVAAATVLIAGAAQASEQSNRQETLAALRAAPGVEVRGKEKIARAAMAWGDNWSAANLLEKAMAETPTVAGRFNLATAYAKTGRFAQAAALYQGLINDGAFTTVALDPSYIGLTAPRTRKVNVAREAAARLERLAPFLATRQAAAPFSATEAGVNAAASTAAPFAAGQAGVNAADTGSAARISNEDAIALDAQARAARTP